MTPFTSAFLYKNINNTKVYVLRKGCLMEKELAASYILIPGMMTL